jgi:hypothetical protein
MDGLHDIKVVMVIYLYCILWFLAVELVKVLVYVVWEVLEFRQRAHIKQFFSITGYGKPRIELDPDEPAPTLTPANPAERKSELWMLPKGAE